MAGEPCGTSADCWSLGIILHLLLCGELPVNAKPASMEKDLALLRAGNFKTAGSAASPHWAHVSDEARALVAALTQVPPKKRPTAAQARKHPWYSATLHGA